MASLAVYGGKTPGLPINSDLGLSILSQVISPLDNNQSWLREEKSWGGPMGS